MNCPNQLLLIAIVGVVVRVIIITTTTTTAVSIIDLALHHHHSLSIVPSPTLNSLITVLTSIASSSILMGGRLDWDGQPPL